MAFTSGLPVPHLVVAREDNSGTVSNEPGGPSETMKTAKPKLSIDLAIDEAKNLFPS